MASVAFVYFQKCKWLVHSCNHRGTYSKSEDIHVYEGAEQKYFHLQMANILLYFPGWWLVCLLGTSRAVPGLQKWCVEMILTVSWDPTWLLKSEVARGMAFKTIVIVYKVDEVLHSGVSMPQNAFQHICKTSKTLKHCKGSEGGWIISNHLKSPSYTLAHCIHTKSNINCHFNHSQLHIRETPKWRFFFIFSTPVKFQENNFEILYHSWLQVISDPSYQLPNYCCQTK